MGAIWFVRGGGLGDILVAAPALAALRSARAGTPRIGLGGGGALRVLRAAGLLDEVLDFEGWEGWRAFTATVPPPVRLSERLRGASALVSFGFGPLRPDLAAQVGGPVADFPPFPPAEGPAVHEHLRSALATCLGPLGDPPAAPLASLRGEPSGVWIHPGSGGAAKNRPLPDYLRLAEDLRGRGHPPRFLLGEAEGEATSAAIRAAGFEVRREALESLAPQVASATLWVGNDTGLTHLAAQAGAPTVALFQASDPRVWRPWGPRVALLGAPGSAASLEEVLGAVRAQLRHSLDEPLPPAG